MNNAKTKLQNLGFTSGHVQLLTVAVAIFAVLIYAKSDINLTAMFASADEEVTMMTYEDALAEATAEQGFDYTNQNDGSEEQLALLDRGEVDGKVLGETIGIGEIPDADEMMLPEISSQLKVNAIGIESAYYRSQYQEWMHNIERDGDITNILAALNSSDPTVLREAVSGWDWVIRKMADVEVPPSLEQYHKNKMIYYSVLKGLGEIYAGDKSESDMPLLAKAMLSFSQKVESMTASLNEQYQLNL
jgi:hypothetical protein